jgi:4-amino-4-deoxy-L-arabinose transferase-like glycosyltransferase
MPVPARANTGVSFGRKDFSALFLVLVYCALYYAFRVAVSSSMELDEAEQYLSGAVFSWGYWNQPPLYSWLVKAFSAPFGMSIKSILAVKYVVLFVFYSGFYMVARTLWEEKRALFATGSLLVLPTYSYQFNVDLTHTILLTAVSAAACLVFIRVLTEGRLVHYAVFGAVAGLGVLSKYNFAFFLSALVLAALTSREGRRALFNRGTLLSVSVCLVILLPHFFWLVENDFPPVRYALGKARTGGLDVFSLGRVFHLVVSAYLPAFVFVASFAAFLLRKLGRNQWLGGTGPAFFRRLAAISMLVPLALIFVLRTEKFSERWLSPLLFTIPLALFTMVDFDLAKRRFLWFGRVMVIIAAGILAARALIGFFPDFVGKAERMNIPFEEISARLSERLTEEGFTDLRGSVIASNSEHLIANIKVYLPFGSHLALKGGGSETGPELAGLDSVIVWDVKKHGQEIPQGFRLAMPGAVQLEPVSAPYLHSKRFTYTLGVAVLRRSALAQTAPERLK